MRSIPEKDWKLIRALKDEMLSAACERILKKVRSIVEVEKERSHGAYLELWNVMRAEDENIALMFDDLRRSNAVQKVAAWKRFGLLQDEQLAKFTEETQEAIRILSEL